MLQNQCKGIIFYPNNQKKKHKKHKLATFLQFGLGMECRNGNETVNEERHAI